MQKTKACKQIICLERMKKSLNGVTLPEANRHNHLHNPTWTFEETKEFQQAEYFHSKIKKFRKSRRKLKFRIRC